MPTTVFFDGKPIDRDETLLEIERVECEESLYQFLVSAWKYIDPAPFTDGWAIEAICEHLQAVCDGQIKRLIINQPPRTSKSSITSVAFPAWVWAQRFNSPTSGPGVPFLTASYGYSLALRDSMKSRRLIDSAWYQRLWGNRFRLTSDQNTKGRFDNDKGGTRLSTSVDGSNTGEGGNCFVAGTMVSTPSGPQPIEALKAGDPVIAFDHLRGKAVISEVVATQVSSSNDFYEVCTLSGNRFVCTGAHPIFQPGRGYVAASEMGRGNRVVVEIWASDPSAPDLRQVREANGQASVRSPQGSQTGQSGRLLFQEMLFGPSRNKTGEAMRDLWNAAKASAHRNLFNSVSATGKMGKTQKADMPKMQGALRWLDSLLFLGLCGRRSLRENAGFAKLALQIDWPLFKSVQGNAVNCIRAGFTPLCIMPSARQESNAREKNARVSSGASHRRELAEQRPRESNFLMSALPQEASSWGIGYIASVTRLSCEPQRVYDIQVKGCSNFFADGVLVHNCVIIDDPNSAQEAFSEATIEKTISWWDGVMSTRLNDPKTGAFVVVQQRLAEDDLTGHILSKDVGEWTHLCLPMRFERDRSFVSTIGWQDPRTIEGELLWPERFGEDEVSLLEKQLGPFSACGQLQQRPEPAGGGVIKREWWKLWEEDAFPPMDFIVASLDTAYTTKTENDFSALTVWGVFTGDTVAQATRIIGRDGRPTYDERSYSDGSPKVMLMGAWQERLELHDLVKKVGDTCKKLKVDKLIIESKAAGHSVAQEIRRLYNNETFAVFLYDPKAQDKLARLYSIQHLFAEGMIYAPDRAWADMVITQVGQFPKGKRDDLVDTVSQALRHMRDLGLMIRGPERIAEIEQMKQYTGCPPQPLYPA